MVGHEELVGESVWRCEPSKSKDEREICKSARKIKTGTIAWLRKVPGYIARLSDENASTVNTVSRAPYQPTPTA